MFDGAAAMVFANDELSSFVTTHESFYDLIQELGSAILIQTPHARKHLNHSQIAIFDYC
jgi:hypothetical protein